MDGGEEDKNDERCIQDVIAQFYSFFGYMMRLKQDIDQLPQIDQYSRQHLLSQLDDIERQYKDNQEWFVTRDVQDVRVGVIGTEHSLKSALVSLFVEGVLEIEGDERDGRSKSKITVDGKSKLLLIREETPSPSPTRQLSQWADVLLLVFNYCEEESLRSCVEFHRSFRETRDNADVPVMLVGVKGHLLSQGEEPMVRTVKDTEVKKVVEAMEKCPMIDISLNQHDVYSLFAHACRLALNSVTSYSTPQWPFIPRLPSVCRVADLLVGPPVSPSHIKRGTKKKSGFFAGGAKGSYSVSKQSALATVAEFGSGRHIPVKEGQVSKKTMGMRSEWKKKYLVLSQNEITYYPSLNDYMSMTNAKTLSLQQITVKIPGQRVPSTSRTGGATANTPTAPIDITDTVAMSDRSNSVSPTSYEYPADFSSPPTPGLRITGSSPRASRYLQDNHSPNSADELSSSTDAIDDSSRVLFTYEHMMNSGRSHNRNSSMDEITLQQLRMGGMVYQHGDPEVGEGRYNTMSRLQTRKGKEKTRGLLGANIDDQLPSEGSTESIGKDKKRKGESYRNSWMSQSEGGVGIKDKDKDKKGKAHKRQRSWGGNKLLDVQSMDGESLSESSEFQIVASDGKIWIFETGSPDEAGTWVTAIEEQIKKIYAQSTSHKRMNSCNDAEKKEIYTMEGNDVCADCGASKPEWASLNHGCLLCIECSGVHRKLGSHISRVRSLSLDEWSQELIDVMLSIGNQAHWSVWEAKRPRNRPNHSTPREDRERFIRAKYISKEFLADIPTGKRIAEQLLDAVKSSSVSVPACLNILAHASPDDINSLHDPPDTWSPLHIACSLGRATLVQLLIWNGADVNIFDYQKRSPLFYARSAGHQDCVAILQTNSCNDDQFTASPTSSDAGSTEVIGSM